MSYNICIFPNSQGDILYQSICYAINTVCEANSFNLLNGCITRVKGARMSKQENHLSRENDEKNISKRGS